MPIASSFGFLNPDTLNLLSLVPHSAVRPESSWTFI